MLRLVTFGSPGVEGDGNSAAPHVRPSWLAMLAVIAAAGDRGIARDRLVAIFWPESDDERARQSARQALYALRQALRHDVVRSSGGVVFIDSSVMSSDMAAFKSAAAARDWRRVLDVTGDFLDGFHLPGAPAFQRWVDEERERIAATRTSARLAIATEASRAGHLDEAVESWRALAEGNILNGRFAVGYLRALAARGDRTEALAFVRRHEAVIRRELEVDPDPDVQRFERELRAMPVALAPTAMSPAREVAPSAEETHASTATIPTPRRRRGVPRTMRRALVGALAIAATLVLVRREWTLHADVPPVFAVGVVFDTARAGTEMVMTDMLATNLARVDGLHVVSNARMMQLLQSDADTAQAYAAAARLAGATDLLEGRLEVRNGDLTLDLRRKELRSGSVRDAITVTARDRAALVDSATVAMARRFRLMAPLSSIAAATTRSEVAYRFYEEGLRAYQVDDEASARRLMRAALADDSTFAMAALYEALLATGANDRTPDGRHASDARRLALRLAARAPTRERLLITASLLGEDMDPGAVAVAESLAVRFPEDPGGLYTLARVLCTLGDWAGAVRALERAIALDARVGAPRGACRVCEHLNLLAWVYQWSDSLEASARTAQRQLAIRPDGGAPLYSLAVVSARRGDSTAAFTWFRRLLERGFADRREKHLLDLRLERYDAFDAALPQLLSTGFDQAQARWYALISLRNQGRIADAEALHQTGRLPGSEQRVIDVAPDAYHTAILALARGRPEVAARVFEAMPPPDTALWAAGHVARHRAWYGTLAGMAWADAGDSSRVRALADAVERWGSRSLFGRDRKAHHYLRGLLHVARHRDEDAVREFRSAIVSPTLGLTRINYELGSALLRLDRPVDAIAALQPALRGELDAANLYVTRTELHERLAEAFDRAGVADSAAAHYAAVVRAWRSADRQFLGRRERAAQRHTALATR